MQSASSDDVVRAVLAVNDPRTSNEERLQYTQAVESLKDGAPDVLLNVGFSLVAREDPFLSHIGWTFIEEVIRFKWNNLSPDVRLELRNKIMQILERGQMQTTIESTSRCVVAMMEHEWPQNWVELVPQLDQLSQIGAIQCATVFSIFRRLVENVVTLASVSCPQRRKDMYNALVLYMPEMIKLSLDRLEQCGSGDDGTLMAKYIIGWLAEVCEWIPSTSLECHLRRMVDVIVRHLNTAERNIYEHAARCLAALAVRKKEKNEEGIVVTAFFRTEIIDAVLRITSMAAEVAHSSEEHYNYLKALSDLLSALGNHLAKVWGEQVAPPNFATYLSAISAFFNHPSLHLKLEACEVLVSLAQHPVLGQVQEFRNIMTTVLAAVPTAMEKIGYPSELPVNQSGHYSQMDYGDDLEWSHMFIRLRERIRVLVTTCLASHFSQLLGIFDEWIYQRVLQRPETITAREWDPMQKFAKIVIQGGFEKNLVDERTRDVLTTINDSMMSAMNSCCNWDILTEVLSIHSALLPTFQSHPSGLLTYIALLQRCLKSSGSHKVLNRHCISQILKVVTSFPDFFKLNAQLLVNLCESVEVHITTMQMSQLLPVLAALSEVVESEELKMELLRRSVAPTLEYFLATSSVFDSLESFISYNGFDLDPPPTFEDGETRADIRRRKELRRHLTALEGVLQQVTEQSPLGSVLTHLYPVFFKLNRVVLELSTSRAHYAMHAVYRDVCQITIAEKQQIYCSVGESMEAQTGKQSVQERNVHEMAKLYVNSLSENCLAIVSLCATKFADSLFSHPSILDMLSCTTAALPDTQAFRMRHWIKKGWRSLLMGCPEGKRELISSLFSSIVDHMKERLDQMWQQVATIDYDAEPTEQELFNEHMTCVLSREYLQMLRLVYMTPEVNSNLTEEKKAATLSGLGEWLFSKQVGLSALISTIFAALTWRDTQSSLKAIPICKSMADKLSAGYEDEIAVFMLVSSIRSLQIHGSDEVAGAPLLGLIFHIYITLRQFSDSFPKVLQQVPDVTQEAVDTFDKKIHALISGEEVMVDKQRREMTKKLLRSVISLTTGEQHRRPVYLRPLPPIEKRRKEEVAEDSFIGLAAMFGEA